MVATQRLKKRSPVVGVDQVPGLEVALHATGAGVRSCAEASLRLVGQDCCCLRTRHPQLWCIGAAAPSKRALVSECAV